MEIGFIGIGQMGRHMAARILAAGYGLTVNDINKAAAAALLGKGAKWADSPEKVAKVCPVVITSLPTPKDVEQVVYGANGLKQGWKAGDIYIDMSTDSPALMRRIARDAAGMRVSVLDAPVSGGMRARGKRDADHYGGGRRRDAGKSTESAGGDGAEDFPGGGSRLRQHRQTDE